MRYKYEALYNYFEKLNVNSIRLTYEAIEKIIEFKLPKSAYEYTAYWYPSKTHTITRSWVENGWIAENVILGDYISFKRDMVEPDQDNKVMYKIEIYLSKELIPSVIQNVSEIGGCKVGDYDNVASYFELEGCWKPTESANPYSGKINSLNHGREYKLEIRCEEKIVGIVLRRIRELHPYEEALINVIQLSNHIFE